MIFNHYFFKMSVINAFLINSLEEFEQEIKDNDYSIKEFELMLNMLRVKAIELCKEESIPVAEAESKFIQCLKKVEIINLKLLIK